MKFPNIFSFAFSIFLGAFLLFQVQPIIGKHMLPWFGGTSSVWITSMLFFQVLLLLGYLYAYFLSRFSLKVQTTIHLSLTILTSGLILYLFFVWRSPITPGIEWKLPGSTSPITQVLQFLLLSVGLPYFLLATTSTVLQNWFGKVHDKQSPYKLYALSNAGSLIGIASYPFLIEPFFSLYTQGFWWAIGFLIYSIAISICCIKLFFVKEKQIHETKKNLEPVQKKVYGFWLVLSATPSIMLLSITALMTQSIAPIPFLWLLPLGLYLISFIICFSDKQWYWRNFYAYMFLVSGPLALVFTQTSGPTVPISLFIFSAALFSSCMLCHGELYQIRPHVQRLNLFYVYVAFGGAVGGILVGIIAPLFFNGIWEIYIGFYLSLLTAFTVLLRYKDSSVYRNMNFFFFSVRELYLFILIGFPLVIFTIALTITVISGYSGTKIFRNFYGVLILASKVTKDETTNYLIHGKIIHGTQHLGKKRFEPTTYYHKKSGVGLLMQNYPRPKDGLQVGLIGLGTGTLAAYGKKGDQYRFYEINPQVVFVAKNYFTYLSDSHAKITVVMGDGRLSLEKEVQEKKEPLDIIVVDAFSDDAIPVHLLTKEAIAVYLQRLKNDGVIAFHISNNYIDLKHLLFRHAQAQHLSFAFLNTAGENHNSRSEWVLLTRNKALLTTPAIARATSKDNQYKNITPWTDEYSNIFQILK